MRFRISSIQDAGLPSEFDDACLFLEDWLNLALGDADFGWPDGCAMVVIFATSSRPKAPAVSRLIDVNGSSPTLALHVVMDPESLTADAASPLLARLSAAIIRDLPAKPLRKPRALDYDRLRKALVACILPHAH